MAPLVCHQQKCADWTARQAWLAVALLKVCRRKYLFGSWPGGLILKEPVVIYLFVHLNLMHAATFKNLQLFNTDFHRYWQRLPERESYNQYLFTVLFQRELRWTTGLKHLNASPAAESKAFFWNISSHLLTDWYIIPGVGMYETVAVNIMTANTTWHHRKCGWLNLCTLQNLKTKQTVKQIQTLHHKNTSSHETLVYVKQRSQLARCTFPFISAV